MVTAELTRDPLKFAPAPDAGAVNVTVTPETALFIESVTVTISGEPKAVLIVELCPDPDVGAMTAGWGLLVSEKLAEGVMPVTLAVTL